MIYVQTLIVLAVGFVAGWLWSERPELLASVRWLEVMTAFGTVGATIAAVSIAYWQHAERKKEKLIEAKHVAAGLSLPLRVMAGAIADLGDRLCKVVLESPASVNTVRLFADEAKAIRYKFPLPPPVSLSPISENCGTNFAIGIAFLDSAIEFLDREDSYVLPPVDITEMNERIPFVLKQLNMAIGKFAEVANECSKFTGDQ